MSIEKAKNEKGGSSGIWQLYAAFLIAFSTPWIIACGFYLYAVMIIYIYSPIEEKYFPPPTPTSRPYKQIPLAHEWLEVPAGPFLMGSNDVELYESDDEFPLHTVELDTYWISRYETTNAQYKLFVDDGNTESIPWTNCRVWSADGTYDLDYANHPVVCVSWHNAVAYTEWLSIQSGDAISLPSEAEWEKAARGTEGQTYPWGDEFDFDKLSNKGAIEPLGSYAEFASPYGAEDMAGSVAEWTQSQYKAYPYDAGDGREDLTVGDAVERVLRTGGNGFISIVNRAASRSGQSPDHRHYKLGFRVVMHPKSSSK